VKRKAKAEKCEAWRSEKGGVKIVRHEKTKVRSKREEIKRLDISPVLLPSFHFLLLPFHFSLLMRSI